MITVLKWDDLLHLVFGIVITILCMTIRYITPRVTDIYYIRSELKYILRFFYSCIVLYVFVRMLDSTTDLYTTNPYCAWFPSLWALYLTTGRKLCEGKQKFNKNYTQKKTTKRKTCKK